LLEVTGQPPNWNFHKYRIAPGGKQVYGFATQVEPDWHEIMNQLKPLPR
jgi:glutathione peroxidase